MSAQQKGVDLSHWICHRGSHLTVWPLGDRAVEHPALRDRITIAIDTGDAHLSLRPTADEVRQLIAALQWSLAAQEPQQAAA